MIELAEQYLEAHSVMEVPGRSFSAGRTEGKNEAMKKPYTGVQSFEGKGQVREFKDRQCYGCGKKDHFIKSCPFKMSSRFSSNTKAAVLEIQKEEVDDTRDQVKQNEQEGDIDIENKTVATCMVMSSVEDVISVAHSFGSKIEVKCVNASSIATSMDQDRKFSSKQGTGNMPVTEGYVGQV